MKKEKKERKNNLENERKVGQNHILCSQYNKLVDFCSCHFTKSVITKETTIFTFKLELSFTK